MRERQKEGKHLMKYLHVYSSYYLQGAKKIIFTGQAEASIY